MLKVTKFITEQKYNIDGKEYTSFDELPEKYKRLLDKDGDGEIDMDLFKKSGAKVLDRSVKRSLSFQKNGEKLKPPTQAEKAFTGTLIRSVILIIALGIAVTVIRFWQFL